MSMTIELGVAELAATRFAISPLSETVACLQQLAGIDRNAVNLPWLRWAREELDRAPLDLSRTWPLVVTGRLGWPEFLVPAPQDSGDSLENDLDALRRTPEDRVRASLDRVFGEKRPPAVTALADDPTSGLREVAEELRNAHDRLVAPHWPRIRAALDADVGYHARALTAGGAERLFTHLHPDLRWHNDRVILAGRRWRDQHRVIPRGPGGLVLMPVVLGSPYVLVKENTSTQTTIRYPARGTGALWAAGTRSAGSSTVRLLGRTRATLLTALSSPATTTDLARALGVTPSAVSQHLKVLRDSGLVARERSGRGVLYLTTPLGERLL
ncbi:ArsR/SmtB family transcription factor [Amycolatopsis sp. NPDC049868]|uniref:ArsR/SmtB family transcription factor n=1 Tax=Amycolatopsis sp. NPDC049868 TaxID=3363934 RepID=UPI00379168DA